MGPCSAVTFWLGRLVPIHLAVEYPTPYDPSNDAGLGLDVTIEQGLVEFLDNFCKRLGRRAGEFRNRIFRGPSYLSVVGQRRVQ